MSLFAKGKCFIIAEIAQAHDGSLGNALAYIDACAATGVDAVKFQDHRGDPNDKFRPDAVYPQDDTRKAYWARTAFYTKEWVALRQRAGELGLAFGVSPFSAFPFKEDGSWRPDFWKIGSGQIANQKIIDMVSFSGLPVVVSTGMATGDELAYVLAALSNGERAILQCTSEYPCPPERTGLNILKDWIYRRSYKFLGLSDHSGTIYPSLAAAALGADVLEVHVCWDKRQFGPDTSSSITIDQLSQLVEGVRFIERMRANPVDKDAMAERLKETRAMFMGGKA